MRVTNNIAGLKSPKPSRVIQQRLDRCRAEMSRHKISAYLITNRFDQIYLTGFNGEDGAAIITAGGVHIITDGRFEEAVRLQAPWARKYLRANALAGTVGRVCKKLRLRKLCFQPDQVSVQLYSALRKTCRPTKLAAAAPIVNYLRRIKDRSELKKLRHAIWIAEEAFKTLKRRIKIGMTETDIAALLEYEMKQRGAIGPSFGTIVAEGKNAALAHAEPGKRVLKKNSLVLIDWGAQSEYYCSDLTRVLFMSKISPRYKKLYRIVLEAQKRAIRAIAPGKRVCDIDRVARDHIAQAGYGDQFGHGLGHGVGLEIHEEPRLKFGFTDELEAGMVVTVEPGIYLPGIGGIRIEDDVLVTSGGHEVLSSLPNSLASAVI